jgi:ribose-phosphate pyrophosphokinase
MKIFSGTANQPLTAKICKHLGIPVGEIYHHTFPSLEKYVQIKENVRGEDVFLVQSTNYPANDNIMELLIMIDACKRASAKRITAVIPSSICYSRQDRKAKSREPISAKLIADMITCAGVNRILGLDFHSQQFGGFFNIPVDQLYAMSVFVDYIKSKNLSDLVVVSPDEGAIKRSSALASVLKSDFAFHSKKRTGDTSVDSLGLIGNVDKKNVLIHDDMIESAGTLIEVSRICKLNGASTVTGLITHNCLTEIGQDRLNNDTCLDKLILTDSSVSIYTSKKIEIVSIAQLFSVAILRTHNNESISELFEIKGF